MSVPRYLVDTYVLLRFLIAEPPVQAATARKLFNQAQAANWCSTFPR